MAPWLQLAEVVRRFGAIEALKGIDLALAADEMLVVLGPTGAGKTTLLRTVAGLETPDAGSIEMGGEDVTYWPPAERDVAFVFQNFALYPDWSVRRNLEFPLRAPGRNMPPAEIDERVSWAAGLLRITDHLDRPAAQVEDTRLPYLRSFAVLADTSGGGVPHIDTVTITGPYGARVGDTPSRDRIFVCEPATETDEPACARQIVTTLARRAYRRPVTVDDLDQLVSFYRTGQPAGEFEGVRHRGPRL